MEGLFRKRGQNGRFVLLTISLLFSGPAPAEESAFELSEIIVVGQRPRIVESTTTVGEISAEQIQLTGARNLTEALFLMPGLHIRTGPDGTPRIEIRGLRTRQIVLLLDGVPFNSAIDGQFDPDSIGVANIDHIDVTRGASSVLYGAGGNAGVINIVTKAGASEFSASGKAEAGGDGVRQGQLSASGGGRDWRGFASFSGYERDGFELSGDYLPVPITGSPDNFQPPGRRLNSDRSDVNVYGNVIWSGVDRTEIGASTTYRKGEYGKPPETRDASGADADPYARRPRFERVDDFEGLSVSLTARHEFDNPLRLRSSLYFNRLDELTNNYDDAGFASQVLDRAVHADTRSGIHGGSLAVSYDRSRSGPASLAGDCHRESWKAGGFEISKAGGTVPIDIDEHADVCSVAYEQEVRLRDDLGLVGGISYAWQDRGADAGDDGAGYLLGAFWDLPARTRIHASHARKIRFPTLRDLYEPGRANPDLTAETTFHYELGVEHSFTAVPATLGVTGFRIDAEDYIEADASGIARNTEKDRFQGVEVTGEIKPFDTFSARAGYTWQRSENRSSGATNPDLPNRPEHRFSLELGWHVPAWGMHLYASWRRVEGNLELSRGNKPSSRETGDHDVVDAKLQKDIGEFYMHIRALNLFDRDYAESGGFPAPGRTVLLGFGFAFGP